jgi:hypothetical protein
MRNKDTDVSLTSVCPNTFSETLFSPFLVRIASILSDDDFEEKDTMLSVAGAPVPQHG